MGDSVDCRQCQTRMEVTQVKKYSGKWPYILIGLGVFCSLFLLGPIVGFPLLIAGIYMATAREQISYCPNCGYYFCIVEKENIST
ncbi:MAG: LITAF-like zinc ribbon domain-containing protein [Deltaproteobacteria bacterium]|nr:LITAF-like zinc ribbon domain-containing protein [Deltaproteobacteria bacterium]